jgi:hypothetical protein
MYRSIVGIGLVLFGLVAGAADAPLVRQMNVTQGPETVFERPPTEFMPGLAGAKRTAEAGRVGNEMVFWGYRRQSGEHVFLFACAEVEGVDCAQRVQAICPSATVLTMQTASGNIVRRSCSAVAVASPGDSRPGCDDREQMAPLSIGLVSCG